MHFGKSTHGGRKKKNHLGLYLCLPLLLQFAVVKGRKTSRCQKNYDFLMRPLCAIWKLLGLSGLPQSIIYSDLKFKQAVSLFFSSTQPLSLSSAHKKTLPDCWRYGLRHNGATCPVRYTCSLSPSQLWRKHTPTQKLQANLCVLRASFSRLSSQDINSSFVSGHLFILHPLSLV